MHDEQEKKSGLGFEVVDKRGQNNPIKEPFKPQSEIADNAPVKERIWRSTDYVIGFSPTPDGTMLIYGRAMGLANDELLCLADYIFSVRGRPGFDWTIDARRRLDTFLQCPCSVSTGMCQFHRRVTKGGWLKEDMDRIRLEGEMAVSEVYEVLSRMERTRAQATRILAPRR